MHVCISVLVPCVPGTYYNSTGVCLECDVGFYQALGDKDSCTPCPTGNTYKKGGMKVEECKGISIIYIANGVLLS